MSRRVQWARCGLSPETRERQDPVRSGGSEFTAIVRKFYPEESKADAVELHSFAPGVTGNVIVADLGVHEGIPSRRLHAADVTTASRAVQRAEGGCQGKGV